MACVLYKGVGVGTHLYSWDLTKKGLLARNPRSPAGISSISQHVARGTTTSPFISLSRSFGVANDYAINAGFQQPTATHPAYVYEIQLPDPIPNDVVVLDPVVEVASLQSNPLGSPSYHHDGDQQFLHILVTPSLRATRPAPVALRPPHLGSPGSPLLTIELETMVRAMRDAEILVAGTIPASWVTFRHPVF